MPSKESAVPDRTLHVDFSWRKYTILIRESPEAEPIYLQKWNCLTMKSIFRTGPSVSKAMEADGADNDSITLEAENPDVIGTSRVRAVHIDVDATHRGRDIRVSADSRLMTRYTYASQAYALDPHKPAIMTWKNNSNIKVFDFDLRDEQGNLVARFNPRYFGIKKMATIELFGPHAWDRMATEEVLITGLSMYLCMQYRTMSFVPLIGAMVSRSGKDHKVTEKQVQEEYERNSALATQAKTEGHLRPDGSSVDPEKFWDHVHDGSVTKDEYRSEQNGYTQKY
jgi:hypothetical protein